MDTELNKKTIRKIFIITELIFAVMVGAFYFLAGDQLVYKNTTHPIELMEADSVSDELVEGMIISQDFVCEMDKIEQMSLVFTKFYRDAAGTITVELREGDKLLFKQNVSLDDIPEQQRLFLRIVRPIRNQKGKTLTIRISADSPEGAAAAIMMNQESDSLIQMNHRIIRGTLCFSVNGSDEIWLGRYYWYLATGLVLTLGTILFHSYRSYLNDRYNLIVRALQAVYKYSFLISQLVLRDFKSKYKRSILGVFWSFLNPLMTMTVQFLVFSTFFTADTQNYPVYLLSGVVCFSFFSECTTMCLSSISGNARLITKVYIPKYIFPLSRSISSSINLVISLVPLILACLILGVDIHPQALLFFYFLACLIVFALGIGMFLSALMVFFRDIQFLWTVLTQIWMYATPIFYPAEIIPEKYKFIVRINPLYHFIGNARTCLINGISPEPSAYVYCFLFAMVSLFIGSYTFKKTQDHFALYL
ncbi:MAG: ABC transporter permease [Erysipelotrichaceae bacterium]|nr:ABC transporter permease [Erysipelotrichaceae bacterium]